MTHFAVKSILSLQPLWAGAWRKCDWIRSGEELGCAGAEGRLSLVLGQGTARSRAVAQCGSAWPAVSRGSRDRFVTVWRPRGTDTRSLWDSEGEVPGRRDHW